MLKQRKDAKGKYLSCSICGEPRWYPPSDLKVLKGEPRCLKHSTHINRQLPTLEKLLWAQVDKNDPSGCWIWKGFCHKGYGYIGKKSIGVHRFSWELAFGPIPEGMDVLHHCDNPPCVRPDHLFLGTQKDNNLDMVKKGRNRGSITLGEANHSHKLTNTQVSEIRESLKLGGNVIALSQKYKVNRVTIYRIKWGKTWKHIL